MNYLFLTYKSSIQKIRIDDIYYIQTDPERSHIINIVTKNAVYSSGSSIAKIREQVTPPLLTCKRNLLVNPHHVSKLNTDTRAIELEDANKTTLVISRSHYAYFMKTWTAQGDEK